MFERVGKYLQDVGGEVLHIASGLLTAAIIAVITWFIARYVARLVRTGMDSRQVHRNGSLLVSRIAYIAVWIVGIGVILARLGVNTTGLVTFLSASTVAISLSLQDVLRNFVSGLILLFERPFQVGDRIKVRDVVGEVQGIDLRTTLIRNSDGYLVMVPNSTIFTEIITNRSHYRTRRLMLSITGPRTAMVGVEERLSEVLTGVVGVRKPMSPVVVTTASAESISLEVPLLVDATNDVERDVMHELAEQFADVTFEVRKPA
ncbi:MAG: mechanosensitive ion channel domain-containing protein [Thermomicrobiales bacterium]